MNIQSTQDLFHHGILDAYDAEQQIATALETMQQKAMSPELQKGLKAHLKQTQEQITRLEQIMELEELEVEDVACKGIQGIIAEGNELMAEDMPESLKDLAIVSSAMRVEHYEMAVYEDLLNLCSSVGSEEYESLLQASLDEEKETAMELENLAQTLISLSDEEDTEDEQIQTQSGINAPSLAL